MSIKSIKSFWEFRNRLNKNFEDFTDGKITFEELKNRSEKGEKYLAYVVGILSGLVGISMLLGEYSLLKNNQSTVILLHTLGSILISMGILTIKNGNLYYLVKNTTKGIILMLVGVIIGLWLFFIWQNTGDLFLTFFASPICILVGAVMYKIH